MFRKKLQACTSHTEFGGNSACEVQAMLCLVCPVDCLGEPFLGARRVGFGFPARFQGCRRGARDLQLLTGPVANDCTSTGTHPHEGAGCSADGVGISPPPEHPLYFLFVCGVFVCVAPVCSAPVVNHLGGLQACSVASPLSSLLPSSLHSLIQ